MAYDLEEQEQLASLKAWWNQYGNLVTWLLTLGLAAYAGWNYWNHYQRNQSAQASQLFDELQKAAMAKDQAKVQRASADIKQKFGSTAYAPMGALAASRAAVDANDGKAAKAELQWVIEQGNDEYKAIARLRLAGLLLDEKAYDEALRVLSAEMPAAFAGMVADRKGDVLVAQNKVEEARAAYRLALDKSGEKNPAKQLIQMKLDALGGADKAA